MGIKEKPHLSEDQIVEENEVKALILHNDDVHTFDYVIDALVDVCKHEINQAEQCTMIVHFKGKCTVKEGAFSELRSMKDGLTSKELSATIE
jgi:ATP-dependent Clp protease adaptor protein ClpS